MSDALEFLRRHVLDVGDLHVTIILERRRAPASDKLSDTGGQKSAARQLPPVLRADERQALAVINTPADLTGGRPALEQPNGRIELDPYASSDAWR